MISSPNWLSRYRAGQRDQVWHELHQLGSTFRGTDLGEEAQLVCDEMAHRARNNIEKIVERLLNDGYRFHSNDDEQTPETPHVPPTATATKQADWLQERFGTVPMILLS